VVIVVLSLVWPPIAAAVFIGLVLAFGVPLVNGVTHLAGRMPGYIASAQHGRGWIGHLVARYHVQSWVQRNTPKDFLPMIGGALAGIPTVLFTFIARGLTAGIATAVVFAVYTQIENHVLNPVVMSKTVRINPLLVFIAVLVGASIGSLTGGIFGGFVAALLAIPTAGALQVLVKEVWQATAPDQPQQSPAPAAEPADE
jgi:predicted PurR-regulated permease PerM